MDKAIIETSRTYLVQMDTSHVDSMAELFSLEISEAQALVDENRLVQKRRGFSVYNVFDMNSGNYIGYCGGREVQLKEHTEVELTWSIYAESPDDELDLEVLFAVRNYLFKHFNINLLVALISIKEPENINLVEAIDMEQEGTIFEGFHKFYVYVVHRSSEKFKASYGDGESGAKPTRSLKNESYSLSTVRNLRKPRPHPR